MQPEALPLWDLIEWRAALTPDALLAVDEHDRTITFGAFRDRCVRVAGGSTFAVLWAATSYH